MGRAKTSVYTPLVLKEEVEAVSKRRGLPLSTETAIRLVALVDNHKSGDWLDRAIAAYVGRDQKKRAAEETEDTKISLYLTDEQKKTVKDFAESKRIGVSPLTNLTMVSILKDAIADGAEPVDKLAALAILAELDPDAEN